MGTDIKARIRAKFTSSSPSKRHSAAPSLVSLDSCPRDDGEPTTPTPAPAPASLVTQLSGTTTTSQPSQPPLDPRQPPDRPPSHHGDDVRKSLAAYSIDAGVDRHMAGEHAPGAAAAAPPVGPLDGSPAAVGAAGNDLELSSSASLPSIHEHGGAVLPSVARALERNGSERHRLVDPLSPATPATATPIAPAVGAPGLSASNSVSSRDSRPTGPARRQSLLPTRQGTLIKTLLQAAQAHDPDALLPINPNMMTRKIWVRRPGASATLITVSEEDLVDDVRELVLKKYANSLGRHFDAPDLSLRLRERDQDKDRWMAPDEPIGRTLDAYYPGGQTVNEALIIDIPHRRTPRSSPRAAPPHSANAHFADDGRPSENGEGYFPPVSSSPTPPGAPAASSAANPGPQVHSISVLGTGQIPPIPSPGGRSRAYRDRPERPRLGRTHTSSPTILGSGPTASISATTSIHEHQPGGTPALPLPLPTPPAPPEPAHSQRVATPPPPRVGSPRPSSARPKKVKKPLDQPLLPPGLLNGGVPPINVLIVEDNPINLKLLEAFMKRLKVRWQTAMNGRDAVDKWRQGGFHLVLMDIQLPVMNGLDATREIRRLERVNSIGVFSSHKPGKPDVQEPDRFLDMTKFKSPVIIVALTASSLQSDRHEALAAGCNDFLTKPVNFVWLERKVLEWGCMQALIDFNGWRKWKDLSQNPKASDNVKKAAAVLATKEKAKAKKNRTSLTASVPT